MPAYTPEIIESISTYSFLARESFETPSAIVDNSVKSFMRPIFLQKHGSCAQASGIGYILTYELNWLRGNFGLKK